MGKRGVFFRILVEPGQALGARKQIQPTVIDHTVIGPSWHMAIFFHGQDRIHAAADRGIPVGIGQEALSLRWPGQEIDFALILDGKLGVSGDPLLFFQQADRAIAFQFVGAGRGRWGQTSTGTIRRRQIRLKSCRRRSRRIRRPQTGLRSHSGRSSFDRRSLRDQSC